MFDGASLTIISGMDQDKLMLVRMEVPLLFDVSSHVNTNRDIKRIWYKEKDSTVYTTEYWSKRNP